MVEIENDPDPSSPTSSRRSSTKFERFFYYESGYNNVPNWEIEIASLDFLFKIFQLIIAIICAGLYSRGYLINTYSITSMMFPNVVFSSFIIITSIIALSYVLGQRMPDTLVRIFNFLGAVFYFISATITAYVWWILGRHYLFESDLENAPEDETDDDNKGTVTFSEAVAAHMLLAQVVLSYINCCLYAADTYLNFKRALRS